MDSIRNLFRIGNGPSSSHTIGPKRAAELFISQNPDAAFYRLTLYGSLAATGKGHMTDKIIHEVFGSIPHEIVWKPDETLPFHPNGMVFEAQNSQGRVINRWQVFSVGGGALQEEGNQEIDLKQIYDLKTLKSIQKQCDHSGQAFWEYVEACEGKDIWNYLAEVWKAMCESIERGLRTEGALPGGLGVSRKAWAFHRKIALSGANFFQRGFLPAYALAVAEENASGGIIVTAPTCGSSGVVPAVLHTVYDGIKCPVDSILRALATAGLIGNLIKFNASISGAEVGCQGEIGAACAMASAAATQLLGGTIRQVEYAAEMGLEHHLGLTCDPVAGMVQIPCIERNVFAATRAVSCANYALFSDGSHRVSFDEIVQVMKQTGHDIPSLYRETAFGGLALAYRHPADNQ